MRVPQQRLPSSKIRASKSSGDVLEFRDSRGARKTTTVMLVAQDDLGHGCLDEDGTADNKTDQPYLRQKHIDCVPPDAFNI